MHVRSVEAIERDAWLYIASEISYRTTPAQQQLCPNRPSTAILTTSVSTATVVLANAPSGKNRICVLITD
jgi:hypothetical protein